MAEGQFSCCILICHYLGQISILPKIFLHDGHPNWFSFISSKVCVVWLGGDYEYGSINFPLTVTFSYNTFTTSFLWSVTLHKKIILGIMKFLTNLKEMVTVKKLKMLWCKYSCCCSNSVKQINSVHQQWYTCWIRSYMKNIVSEITLYVSASIKLNHYGYWGIGRILQAQNGWGT
jgi:hypothetical protein